MNAMMLLAAVLSIPAGNVKFDEVIPEGFAQARLSEDRRVALDLSSMKRIEFDFRCADFSFFEGFSLYFKGGETWLKHGVLPTKPIGTWEHFVLDMRDFKVDEVSEGGKADVLRDINTIRFSAWRGSTRGGRAEVEIRNMIASDEPVVKSVAQPVADGVLAKSGSERRMFWCHRAYGVKDHTWEDVIRRIKEAGFTDIFPNMCRAGCVNYESHVYPMDSYAVEHGDQLVACLKACRKYGVRCHVWKVCWNLSRNPDPVYWGRMKAEGRLQMDAKGKCGKWLCPANPVNRREETAAMVELAGKGVDGIHFDYIRYEDPCYCATCRRLFEQRIGRKLDRWPQNVLGGELAKEWSAFMCDNITALVRDVSVEVRRRYPKVAISAAVFPTPTAAYYQVGQDWCTWMKKGYLDFVCCMGYTRSTEIFREILKRYKREAPGMKIYPGIGFGVWPDDGFQRQRLCGQIEALREAGYDGFCIFDLTRHELKALPLFSRVDSSGK